VLFRSLTPKLPAKTTRRREEEDASICNSYFYSASVLLFVVISTTWCEKNILCNKWTWAIVAEKIFILKGPHVLVRGCTKREYAI
jgi:hypothetical protein